MTIINIRVSGGVYFTLLSESIHCTYIAHENELLLVFVSTDPRFSGGFSLSSLFLAL
jgi:hypothetical protein